MPNTVTRRIIVSQLTHEADGTVSSIQCKVQYEQGNDQNPAIQLSEQRWIYAGGDDLSTGDRTSLTNMASRMAAICERVEPLVGV